MRVVVRLTKTPCLIGHFICKNKLGALREAHARPQRPAEKTQGMGLPRKSKENNVHSAESRSAAVELSDGG